ncbi:MAG: TonB-dependent receptor [Flavobacteriales bacterium]|nr:TonB-dependent receptor [Flavobacteriales bacterium]
MNRKTMQFHRPVLAIVLLAALPARSQQTISGQVLGRERDGSEHPLPMANVLWAGTTRGASTDAEGRFTVPAPTDLPAQLVATFVGYTNDTLLLGERPSAPLRIVLSASLELGTVEVVERQNATRLDARSILSQEELGLKELKRAACCDLSESFETNATVDVSYGDAVSGTRTIRMLGLDGRYAQMNVENLPFIRGLSSTYGLSLIPGTWIGAVNVSKGVGTTVNGPNAMTGQIDLHLLPPSEQPLLFVNAYGNSQGRAELNVHSAQHLGRAGSNLLLVHGNLFDTEMDQNHDGFQDRPLARRINVMDRWMYLGERRSAQLAVRYALDDRTGGQRADLLGDVARPDRLYTIDLRNEMIDVFGKHGIIFRDDPTKSIGVLFSLRRHDVSALYGDRTYFGQQESAYLSTVYQMLLTDGQDQLKAGLTWQYDEYAEAFTDSAFARNESMPGAFAEYTMHRGSFTLVGGARLDRNSWYGTVAAPRLHLKFDPGPLTTVRLSGGYGFRSANPFVETPAMFASSRRVVVEGELGMERAWNFGGSALHKFKWLGRKWALGIDGYHTRFVSQVIADLDRSPQVIALYMLDGPSYANSLLADVQVDLTRALLMKVSYRWYDVRTTNDGVLRERPLTPRHRGLVDLAWTSLNDRWRADVTWNVFGPARVPSTASNPEAYRTSERGPSWSTLNAQITRAWDAWEIYLGGENLTSTLQSRQIIASDDPFGPYFDASLIWGPIDRAMVYAGIRYSVGPKKKERP